MQKHSLIIDIGNSFIKCAVFRENEIVFYKRTKKLLVSDIKQLKSQFGFEKAIYSSVRKNNPKFVQHLIQNYHLLELKHNTKIPIVNLYKTPKTLGLDRLAAAVGGNAKFPNQNVLIIDLGTCIKYDFVDKDACYQGGNIAPGLEMRLESMHILTARLPKVKRKYNEGLLGKSTTEALQNGAVLGIKCEIEHFIKTLTKKTGKLKVILTGGDSKYFGEILESKIFVLPDLVLTGLNEILLFNQD
jgi:type III pantothenate kinase